MVWLILYIISLSVVFYFLFLDLKEIKYLTQYHREHIEEKLRQQDQQLESMKKMIQSLQQANTERKD